MARCSTVTRETGAGQRLHLVELRGAGLDPRLAQRLERPVVDVERASVVAQLDEGVRPVAVHQPAGERRAGLDRTVDDLEIGERSTRVAVGGPQQGDVQPRAGRVRRLAGALEGPLGGRRDANRLPRLARPPVHEPAVQQRDAAVGRPDQLQRLVGAGRRLGHPAVQRQRVGLGRQRPADRLGIARPPRDPDRPARRAQRRGPVADALVRHRQQADELGMVGLADARERLVQVPDRGRRVVLDPRLER